jgi:hypothetical protein
MPQSPDSEYFIAKAEQCFRLAQHVRGEHSNTEIAAELEAIANEFLAHAVAIDTERERADAAKQSRSRR